MTGLDHRTIRAADADVIVIGAGLNGLVCAALLAQSRLRVLILEAQERPGGFCVTGEIIPGYRAPLYTPWIGPIDAGLVKALKLQSFGLDPAPQRLSTVALSPDGAVVVLDPHARRGTGTLAKLSPADAKTYPPFAAAMRKLASGLAAAQSEPPLKATAKGGAPLRVKQDDSARTALSGLALRSIADLTTEYFESPLLQGALAMDAVTGTGLGPHSPGSALAWIEAMAMETLRTDTAVWVQGGPGALIQALTQAAQSAGARLRAAAPVADLIAHAGRAEGVVLANGEAIYAPLIVSSQSLADVLWQWPSLRRAAAPGFDQVVAFDPPRHGLAKIHLALRGAPQFTGLDAKDLRARMLMPGDLETVSRAYAAAVQGEVSETPALEAILPTAMDPTLGPKDGHVLSVLVPFAPLSPKGGWAAAKTPFTLSVIAALSRYAPDLPQRVLSAEAETPDQMARISARVLWRQADAGPTHADNPYAGPIEGLYFCGAGTHPRLGASGLNGRNCAESMLATGVLRREGA